MPKKMPCHIDDSIQDPDFAEYQEPEPEIEYAQQRLDERRGIQLRISMAIDQLTRHNTFNKAELTALLKRVSRYLDDV